MSLYSESFGLYKTITQSFNDDYQYYYDFCKGYKSLELFAGYGRVSNFLIKNDIDLQTVEIEKKFAQDILLPTNKNHIQNVLEFKSNEKFNRIFAAYNSFCLLTEFHDLQHFFHQLDNLLLPNGLVSLSYYQHDYWHTTQNSTFIHDNMPLYYQPSFDLSRKNEGIGVWIDSFIFNNETFSYQYPTKIITTELINDCIKNTNLILIDEIIDFNNSEISEPGWIDYVLLKEK